MQFHITLHPDTTAKIGTRGQDYLTATVSGSRLYGAVDGRMVERLAIANGSIIAHIVDTVTCPGQ